MKILITGSTSGIAYEVAIKLAERGHKIYMCTHTEEQRDNLITKLASKKLNIIVYKLDICNKNDLKLLDILDYDILWTHAGVGRGGALLGIKGDALRKNYDVNVFGTLSVIRKAYQNMKERNIAGKIFVTSSLAGYLTLEYLGCYTSSKAALSSICYTIKKELKSINSNISLTMIEPGAYHTGFNQVMIDNKTKYLEESNIFYDKKDIITNKQNKLFNFIEKKNYHDIVTAIIKGMESKYPPSRIRKPLLQSIATKLYVLIFK